MTPVVQDFLTTFDRLTDSERLDWLSFTCGDKLCLFE
jgi:hypothetical protein